MLLELYRQHSDIYLTDKETRHCYISRVYDKYLSSLPKNISLLEIGVQEGYSIKLWADFFNKGRIVGLDVKNVLEIPQMGSNYEILFKDAYDQKTILEFNEKFDVIIDDGPHTFESQEYTIKNYFDLLKPGGIMFIEDIPPSYPLEYMSKIRDNSNLYDFTKITGVGDDIILVIQKPYSKMKFIGLR